MPYDVEPLRLPDDHAALVAFLSSERWPFHGEPDLAPARVAARIGEGAYGGPDVAAFWLVSEAGERVGLVKIFGLEDVDDGTPLFDLRIREAHRGRKLGHFAVAWLTSWLFGNYPGCNRVGGTTRADNAAMRQVFRGCGYVKEAHYREGWPTEGGPPHDAVEYAVLRRDWETGTTTPVPRDDG